MNILRAKRKVLGILDRVEADQSYLHLLLREAAEDSQSDPEEYPVVVRLTKGVLERRVEIDAALEPLLPRGTASLPRAVLQILRLGAYQILFLERVKKRDVVFEAVELAKRGRFAAMSTLVNAVLRKLEPPNEERGADVASGILSNFPEWMVQRWCTQFGDAETERFCEAVTQPMPLYLRVNTSRIDRDGLQRVLRAEGIESVPAEFSEVSLRVVRLPKTNRIAEFKSYRDGFFFVQDLSSTVVADIVSSDMPSRVLDVCAAPGGKACSIALSIAPGGKVIAVDRTETRVGLIRQAVARLGLATVEAFVRDGAVSDGEDAVYDAVLVDAPCSGFGTVGRKIDARWSKSEETIAELVRAQKALLGNAARHVRLGGSLVYSTCTIERAENEEISQWFLGAHPEFIVCDLRASLNSRLCTSEGFYRAWPHHHEMAGAFAAKFTRIR